MTPYNIISTFEMGGNINKLYESRKNKSNFPRRRHQKKDDTEKKELMLSRKKMSRLVTYKIRQRTMNKVEEQNI